MALTETDIWLRRQPVILESIPLHFITSNHYDYCNRAYR